MHSYLDNTLVGTVFITPSMTTSYILLYFINIHEFNRYTNQNPSFRIFEIDQETNLPVNYFQYRLNLSKVNSNISNDPLKWDLAYDMLSVLSIKKNDIF